MRASVVRQARMWPKLELYATRRYYFMPELWYRLSSPNMRYVRVGYPPNGWVFDRIIRVFPGLWRACDEPRESHHILFRRVGE